MTTATPNPRRDSLKMIALYALSASTIANLYACSEVKPSFKGIDLTGADYAQGFELPDHNGQVRTLRDFVGKAVVVFFGFTQCPDVCPTSLAELAETKKRLGADGDRLQGIFISVDPERDTPEIMKAYMASFDPSFLALHATPAQLEELAKAYKLYYKKVPGSTPGNYSMDHSAGSYVYDPQGRIRLYHRYGTGAEALTADVKVLLAQKG